MSAAQCTRLKHMGTEVSKENELKKEQKKYPFFIKQGAI